MPADWTVIDANGALLATTASSALDRTARLSNGFVHGHK